MKLEPIADTPPVTLAPRDDKSRRRSNAAPGYRLPFTAESLESGVTLETLLELPVPVLAYATQITIHGTLADFQPGLVSRYKHLTRNGNGSLGVRWGAIDSGKKHQLRESIRWVSVDTKGTPWHATQNSKGTTLTRTVETVAEGRAAIAALPTGIYGSACLMRCILSGTIFVDVEVGAIAAASLWSVISHFAPGYHSEEILRARDARAEQEYAARKAASDLAVEEKQKRNATMREKLRATIASHLTPWTSWKPAPGRLIRITKLGTVTTPILAKRGPNLCIMHDGKGAVVSKGTFAQWQEDAAAGYFFPYDEARIPAIKAALQSLQESMKAESPAPAPEVPDRTSSPSTLNSQPSTFLPAAFAGF